MPFKTNLTRSHTASAHDRKEPIPKAPGQDESELSSGRSEHRYRARPPDPVTPPIRRIRELPPLAGPAALGDQPANDRHHRYGGAFRRAVAGVPGFVAVRWACDSAV